MKTIQLTELAREFVRAFLRWWRQPDFPQEIVEDFERWHEQQGAPLEAES